MTLNQEFRDAILANNYRKCVFNPDEEGTEVCHILANSKANVKLVQKYFNCTQKEAQDLINMPLLNTVWGSRKANMEYCKTEDIKLIDEKLSMIAYSIMYRWFNDNIINNYKLYNYVHSVREISFGLQALNDTAITEIVKQIQYDFQRKIKAHF
ncbi:hypothetical protein [Brachyspira innocens]|uniref:hypothetical protein n=1 Tax=Brachyspira innocens TaxID=13264 RepID=UPI0026EC077D|nr:hypothetical protein [Brachyspira innocens]